MLEQDESPTTAAPFAPGRILLCVLLSLLFAYPMFLGAQTVSRAHISAVAPPVATVLASPAIPASLSGLVVDVNGGTVPGARVSLHENGTSATRTTQSDSAGQFTFAGLAAGTYALSISAPGLATFAAPGIQLHAGQADELPTVTLAMASTREEITVTLSRRDLATEEMHAEEHQRVLGFPDFYTSFAWNAAPLDAGQKFRLALRSTTDRMSFLGAALIAGGEQIQNTFPEYGGGAEGYAKRYGAAYTDAFVGKFIGSALLPAVFRQDPRYFYMGHGTPKQRAAHAILSAVLTRGDNGRLEPNYSHIFGNAAAGAISTTCHPAADSVGKLALDNALLGIVGEAGVNLVREFLLRPFVHGVAAGPQP